MSYRTLIIIVLSNLLTVAYAMDNPPHNLSNTTLNSDDPYQYCFKNSTWLVPSKTLLAYRYDSGTNTHVSDQTVWVFSKYHQGYFFGNSYTALDPLGENLLSQRILIGSVTSEGKVYIAFYSNTSTNIDIVNGIGTLNVKSSGQCYFVMQMNTGASGTSGLTHWSYMVPVNPGDALYENVPGTQKSVPQFLKQFI